MMLSMPFVTSNICFVCEKRQMACHNFKWELSLISCLGSRFRKAHFQIYCLRRQCIKNILSSSYLLHNHRVSFHMHVWLYICSSEYVWIGYWSSRGNEMSLWRWSDGTTSSYTCWGAQPSGNSDRGALISPQNKDYVWENKALTTKYQTFLCEVVAPPGMIHFN